MIHLIKYESFANLQESSQIDSKDKAEIYVHWFLYTLFLDNICKWFNNQNKYFVSSRSTIPHYYYGNYYTGWINDIMNNSDRIEYLDSQISRYSYCENTLEIVSKVETESKFARPFIILRTPTLANLSFMKQENIVDRNHQRTIEWVISLQDFLSNYISDSDTYHFKKDFIEDYTKSISDEFVTDCTSVLLNYRSLNKSIMNGSLPPLEEYFDLTKRNSFTQISDHLDFVICNDALFQDILLKVKEKQFEYVNKPLTLPDVLSFHILMNGSDVMIREYYFTREFINAIESSPKLLLLCKNNIPQLYKHIKKERGEGNDWKTDLTADMGDLGF